MEIGETCCVTLQTHHSTIRPMCFMIITLISMASETVVRSLAFCEQAFVIRPKTISRIQRPLRPRLLTSSP